MIYPIQTANNVNSNTARLESMLLIYFCKNKNMMNVYEKIHK